MTVYEKDERSSAIPVFIGFLLGVGLALVLTPKSGQQLRGDFSRGLNRGARSAKDTVEETVELLHLFRVKRL